jgi:hypothetical protein
MVSAIISLLTNTFISGLAFIGGITVINKLGKFFKTIEQEENDGFKKGFDIIMVDSIDQINTCVDSLATITSNLNRMALTIYDIVSGNKIIKKNKDGKIIITSHSKVNGTIKSKIDELNNKVKIYEDELNKMKKKNLKTDYVNIEKDSAENVEDTKNNNSEEDDDEDNGEEDSDDAEEDDENSEDVEDAEDAEEDSDEDNKKVDIIIKKKSELKTNENIESDEFFLEK